MKLALISDIHGNLEALDAVFEDIRARDPDARMICAGDIVGYGPDPDACIESLMKHDVTCILGNHDEMVLGRRDFSRCVYAGIKAAVWTRRVISPRSMKFLDELPGHVQPVPEVVVCHGDLLDADTYVSNPEQAERALSQLADGWPDVKLLVCGHTHHAAVYSRRAGFQRIPGVAELALDDEGLVINPGAVGQSRDGKPLARYAMLDVVRRSLQFRELSYDHTTTLRKLQSAGLVAQVVMTRPTGLLRYVEAIKLRWARFWANRLPAPRLES